MSWGMRVSGIAASVTTMAYLLMATSPEFRVFAPLIPHTLWPTVAALILGVACVALTSGLSEGPRIVILLGVLILPILIYGAALVSLWVSFAGTALIDLFVMAAGQRMFSRLITTGAITAVSMMLALFGSSYVGK